MEKISWTDRVKNEITKSKKERNKIRTTKRSKANWIGHILFTKCLLNMLFKKR